MSQRRLYLAAYDVCDAKRLRAALYTIKGHASGGQKSVFECFLTDGERLELLGEMESVLQLTEDRFLLLPLAPAETIRTLGIAAPPSDPAFYYVG